MKGRQQQQLQLQLWPLNPQSRKRGVDGGRRVKFGQATWS